MHELQRKIILLSLKKDLSQMTLRDIGELIGVGRDNPQKTKHHLQQLVKSGILKNKGGKYYRVDVKKENLKSKLISLPIYGTANCGEAISFADDYIQGYLKVSPSIVNNKKGVFVVKAKGNSMNKSIINGENIDDGDYVLIDSQYKDADDGDYVLSIIDGLANIKKMKKDPKRKMIMLLSESSSNYDPIYIHQDDGESYSLAGRVIGVLKV